MLPGLMCVPALSGAKTLTFVSSNKSNDPGSATVTFTAQNIGGSGDIIICILGYDSAASTTTLNNVTIGGSAATLDANVKSTENSDSTIAAVARLRVTSGTTATIVLTFSATVVDAGILVYRLQSSPTGALLDSGSDTINPLDMAGITAAAGDITLSIASYLRMSGPAESFTTWTNNTADQNYIVRGPGYGVWMNTAFQNSALSAATVTANSSTTPTAGAAVTVVY